MDQFSRKKIKKENNLTTGKKSLLVKYLNKKKISNYDILDLGGGIAVEYQNIKKYFTFSSK